MLKLSRRFAFVLLGAGLAQPYFRTFGLWALALLYVGNSYGILAASLALIPGLLISTTFAIAVSIPLQFLGALVLALGIKNQGASPFTEPNPESLPI